VDSIVPLSKAYSHSLRGAPCHERGQPPKRASDRGCAVARKPRLERRQRQTVEAEELLAQAEAWRPWRAYAAMHL
jgi:hypothetical protein